MSVLSDSWYNIPSLIVACTFGALAIIFTLIGICKAISLISDPSTPDLLSDANISLATIRTRRPAARRPVQLLTPRDQSPPNLPRSGQAPVNTVFTPLLKPVVRRESSTQTAGNQARGSRAVLGRYKSSPRLPIYENLPGVSELALRDVDTESAISFVDFVDSESPSPRDKNQFTMSFH